MSNLKLDENIIKDQCVVIIIKDRNGKPHIKICENMELATKLFGSCEKRLTTFYKEKKEEVN